MKQAGRKGAMSIAVAQPQRKPEELRACGVLPGFFHRLSHTSLWGGRGGRDATLGARCYSVPALCLQFSTVSMYPFCNQTNE